MRKYLVAPMAVYAGLNVEKLVQQGGAEWGPLSFFVGLAALLMAVLLLSGRGARNARR